MSGGEAAAPANQGAQAGKPVAGGLAQGDQLDQCLFHVGGVLAEALHQFVEEARAAALQVLADTGGQRPRRARRGRAREQDRVGTGREEDGGRAQRPARAIA